VNGVGWFALGAVAALVVASRFGPATTSTCCARVAAGARERVSDAYGEGAAAIGDAIEIWPHVPDVLDWLGVNP